MTDVELLAYMEPEMDEMEDLNFCSTWLTVA
jgi:hypothetical protein